MFIMLTQNSDVLSQLDRIHVRLSLAVSRRDLSWIASEVSTIRQLANSTRRELNA